MNEIILFLNEKGNSRSSGWCALCCLCTRRGLSTLFCLVPCSILSSRKTQSDLLIGHQLGPFGDVSLSVRDSPVQLQTVKWRACSPEALFVPQPASLSLSFFNPRLPWSCAPHGATRGTQFLSNFPPAVSHYCCSPPVCGSVCAERGPSLPFSVRETDQSEQSFVRK